MKIWVTIALAFLILLQPLSKLILVAEYQVNKNYIAEFLCINKSKPQLHCEGKCQLSKQLKAVEAQEDDNPSAQVKNLVHVQYFYQATPTFSFQFPTVSTTKYPGFSIPEVTSPAFGIFHPPCFLG